MGIDGLDCAAVTLQGGRARSDACFANGGAVVDLDVDLIVRSDGAIVHDGIVYVRHPAPPPCP